MNSCPEFLWQIDYTSPLKMNGWNIHLRGRRLGLYSMIFILALPSQEEEGFLPLFNLDQQGNGVRSMMGGFLPQG